MGTLSVTSDPAIQAHNSGGPHASGETEPQHPTAQSSDESGEFVTCKRNNHQTQAKWVDMDRSAW